MDAPPDAAPTATPAPEERIRTARLQAAWIGAKRGFRVGRILGAIGAVPLLLASLCLMAFGLGSGRGLGVPSLIDSAIVVFAFFAIVGTVPGAVFGALLPSSARQPSRSERLTIGRRTGCRRWRRIAGGLIALLLALSIGLGVAAGRLVDRRLALAIAEAERVDPHWRLEDMESHRAEVVDEDNAAIVAAAAVDLLPEDWPRSAPAAAGQPPETPAIIRALERLDETPDATRLDDATAVVMRETLDELAAPLEIVRELSGYSKGRHEVEYAPNLLDTRLAETEAVRKVARLLRADAALLAHDGEFDAALESCRAAMVAGRSIGDEPFLISQLVRVAIGREALRSARRTLGQGEPTEPALEALQRLVLEEFQEPLLTYALRGERATLVELVRRIRDGELTIGALSGGTGRRALASLDAGISSVGRLMFDYQQALALEWMTRLLAAAQRPPWERPPLIRAWEDELKRVRRQRFSEYIATIPLLLSPAVPPAADSYTRYQADLGATALLFAAERHRMRSGRWPDSIADIDRSILAESPVDPFTGQPYRFVRREGGLLIYSVGPNLRDDAGEALSKARRGEGPDDITAYGWDPDRRGTPPSN